MLTRVAYRHSLSFTFLLVGCSPASLVEVTPPSTVVDPATVATPAGAMQLYALAAGHFAATFGGAHTPSSFPNSGIGAYVSASGYFTDELRLPGTSAFLSFEEFDLRRGFEGTSGNGSYEQLYRPLHMSRVEAQQAIDALHRYAPGTAVQQGRLYALQAYTVLFLAEGFCSGIPLTSVPLIGAPQPSAGLTTEQLFERALALFDSAVTLSADSARFLQMAKIGRARTLLGLGRLADAAAAVQGIPTNFTYAVEYNSTSVGGGNVLGWRTSVTSVWAGFMAVEDREGINGLVWSTDPRAAVSALALSGVSPVNTSGKYKKTSAGVLDVAADVRDNPIRLADGLEARLIEAEADLSSGGSAWLTTLNTLRATCVGSAPCAPIVGLTSAVLPPLADPGTPTARLDLLMRERAMWLYLTGHRQGDLRRLARVYDRDPETLWPTGPQRQIQTRPTGVPELRPYGTYFAFLPDPSEALNNPLYSGCYHFDP